METFDNPIRLEFVLSKEEFLDGQRTFCSSLGSRCVRLNYKAMMPIGILLILEGCVLFYVHVEKPLQILVALLGFYFIVNRLLLWPRRITREFKKYPDHDSLRTFDLDNSSLRARTSLASGEMLWTRFSKFTETDKSFLLLAPPRFLYTLPKRAVPPELLEPLRSLLSQKMTRVR
ncbi:MAG TPA: YcxB family protein [Candidatus Sulfotelmatobacter sp.]